MNNTPNFELKRSKKFPRKNTIIGYGLIWVGKRTLKRSLNVAIVVSP
jgi:hypothetical protein